MVRPRAFASVHSERSPCSIAAAAAARYRPPTCASSKRTSRGAGLPGCCLLFLWSCRPRLSCLSEPLHLKSSVSRTSRSSDSVLLHAYMTGSQHDPTSERDRWGAAYKPSACLASDAWLCCLPPSPLPVGVACAGPGRCRPAPPPAGPRGAAAPSSTPDTPANHT